MIIIILALISIALASLERFLYIKKDGNESFTKIRLSIKILILSLLFLISYYVTDTATGLAYVFLSICMFFIIGRFSDKKGIGSFKYLITVVEIILGVYLLVKANQNMLVSINYIAVIVLTITAILSTPYNQRPNFKQISVSIVSIIIVFGIMIAYSKLPGSKDIFVAKKERIAQKFLKEELNLSDFEVYPDIFDRALRGEEAQIRAYNPSETRINMVYRNGEIIRYKINEF